VVVNGIDLRTRFAGDGLQTHWDVSSTSPVGLPDRAGPSTDRVRWPGFCSFCVFVLLQVTFAAVSCLDFITVAADGLTCL
jgi:hypothetical protein